MTERRSRIHPPQDVLTSVITMSRRRFLGLIMTAVTGGAAVGALADRYVAPLFEKYQINDEPYEVQIRRLERLPHENLTNHDLLTTYAWLLASWYQDKTFGILDEPDDEYAATSKIYRAIDFITDPYDPRIKDLSPDERFLGQTIAQTSIEFDLTLQEFNERHPSNIKGAPLTPLMFFRDKFVHEATHFIVKSNTQAKSLDAIKDIEIQAKNWTNMYAEGFALYFEPDPNDPNVPTQSVFSEFDEISTELISNTYQLDAGFAIGPATYSKLRGKDLGASLDLLRATLELTRISIDDFALLHAFSDIDGLAIRFAKAASQQFNNDNEKISYGLQIIQAIKDDDRNKVIELLSKK